ncbi:MAG: hypothetical protein V1740_03850 [Candidatus Woesearchaeota archaeon]
MFWKKPASDIGNELDSLPPLPGEFGSDLDMDMGPKETPPFGRANQYQMPVSSPMSNQFGQPDISTPSFAASANPFKPVEQSHGISGSMSGPDIISSKNIEIVSSKIDALAAHLDSIDQRLRNIERVALQEEQKSYQRRW